jgi:hypothetical protein
MSPVIAKAGDDWPDPLPLRSFTESRDEIKAVERQVDIAGADDAARVRQAAQCTVDELVSPMMLACTD